MPTEEQYYQMVINKTSVLPRICVRMIAKLLGEDVIDAETAQNIVIYIEALGIAF